ncbi:MarR family winged helix-turn-helix transcriptional regulator [Arthrobacter sp. D3-16]
MPSNDARLTNQSWESLLRAQVAVARRLSSDAIWTELSTREYDVLYTLSKSPEGLRLLDLSERIMLTQTGITRLVARLEERGLITRTPDPADARAVRLTLTPEGRDVQRRIGTAHARSVTCVMAEALEPEELQQLQALCDKLAASVREKNQG